MPADTKPSYDVIVIGAGVVGSLVARELSRYMLDVLLIDKASDVGEGTTKANTAIVHAGYDAEPGTLKAELNVAGNAMFDDLCQELEVEFDRCGTYVVAQSEQDWAHLHELLERGRANGVPKLCIIDAEAMRRREPGIAPDTLAALFAPTGGIVDPFGLCIGAAENAVMNGVDLMLETTVTDLIREHGRIAGVVTDRGLLRSRWVVVAAGLWADELLRCAGLCDFTLKPRKGEYFVLDRVAAENVHHVLFPCPTPISKGILVTPTIHGNVMLGPNASDTADRHNLATTSAGLSEVLAGALKLIPSLDRRQVIRTFAGLRASGNLGDFVIDAPQTAPGLLALAGIDSPGLTASPAIAQRVITLLEQAGLVLHLKPAFRPQRKAIPRFALLSRAERQALIAQDARYGRVICRCETVTEGEIVAACHSIIPARTYDALKRRTRVGTGRCQGGFDLPLVIEIMARELGVSPQALTKRGPASPFLMRSTKAVAS